MAEIKNQKAILHGGQPRPLIPKGLNNTLPLMVGLSSPHAAQQRVGCRFARIQSKTAVAVVATSAAGDKTIIVGKQEPPGKGRLQVSVVIRNRLRSRCPTTKSPAQKAVSTVARFTARSKPKYQLSLKWFPNQLLSLAAFPSQQWNLDGLPSTRKKW